MISVPDMDIVAFMTKQRFNVKKAADPGWQPQSGQGRSQKFDYKDNL